jgi:transcriptional regulator with XRE-family HTH domain
VSTVALSDVGVRMAAARRRAGLTQRELATRLGTTPWWIEEAEHGRTSCVDRIGEIAVATGADARWLAAGDPVRETQATLPAAPLASAGRLGRELVVGGIVAVVTIRFFTEVVPLLPRAANFIDIPLFLTAVFLLGLLPRERRRPGPAYMPVALLALAFGALAVISAVANSFRVEPAPVLVFLYGFLAPLAIYAACYRLWPAGNAHVLSRTIVALGALQIGLVATMNLPRFLRTGNPDDITGTFGTNAYQLVFFLLVVVALGIGIATCEGGTLLARVALPLVAASLVVMLLAQYRSLLIPMVTAIVAVAYLLRSRGRGVLAVGFAAAAFVAAFTIMSAHLPFLKLRSAAASLGADPGSYAAGRLGVAQAVFRLYADIPTAVVVGTGPGTYSSRAWHTFARSSSTSRSNVAGFYARTLRGETPYRTDVAEKYILPQIDYGRIVEGSRAISQPYSSYTAVLAELGVGGLVLLAAVYLGALRRSWRLARRALARPRAGDPLPALLVATVVAFLTIVQMALLDNWLEVARVTFFAWPLLAVCAKEMDAREPS